MDAYFAAKARLFTDILMHAGVAVINIDDPYGRKLAKMITADTATPRVVVTLGFAEDADFQIIKIEPVAGMLQMTVSHQSRLAHSARIVRHLSGNERIDRGNHGSYERPAPAGLPATPSPSSRRQLDVCKRYPDIRWSADRG